MIPSIINLRIQSGSHFKLRLWLPVFIVWPILLVLFLLLLPFLVIADFVLFVTGVRIKLFRILGGVLSVLSAMRGTVVRVNSPKSDSIVNVTIL
jgi:small neutral amino acid transporter SnatA (MarC family)